MSCVLCDSDGGELVWQDGHCRVIVANEAGYPGLIRVVWGAHVAELSDLTLAERHHLMAVVTVVERVVRETMRPTKVNLAALGNMVPHLHWHVIPRYADDAHFPQAIWGSVQRRVPNDVAADRAAMAQHLPDALQKALAVELH